MKPLTQQLLRRFAKIGRQEQVKDPTVVAKFFNPTGAGTWYATEYDPESVQPRASSPLPLPCEIAR